MASIPDVARDLIDRTRRDTDAFRRIAAPLTPRQLTWEPAPGAWSVGMVLEHLLVTNELYLAECERMAAHGPAAAPGATWRPTFIGRMLRKAVGPESTRRTRSPKVFRPGPRARDGVLQAFVAQQDRLVALIERTLPLDWSRTRGASPVSPLIRFNLGDAFGITVAHTSRHLAQARRVVAEEGFPAA